MTTSPIVPEMKTTKVRMMPSGQGLREDFIN
jgi:hypothetical protein